MILKPRLRVAASKLAIVGVCAAVFSSAAQSGPPPNGSPRKEAVTDPQYSMTAFTIDVPANWKFAGAIARDGGCHSTGPSMKFTMTSNDGITSVIALAPVQWNWSSDKNFQLSLLHAGCTVMDFQSAAAFLINIAIPSARPNAHIEALLPLTPEGQASIKAQQQRANESNNQMAARYGIKPMKTVIDGARVKVDYVRNGKPVEEMFVSVIDCQESQVQMGFRAPISTNVHCSNRGLTIMRAPKGQLDAFVARPEIADLSKSVQVNPEWMSRVNADAKAAFDAAMKKNHDQFESFMKNAQAQHDAALEQGREFQEMQKRKTAAAMSADRANQAAIDDAAHRTVLYSLDRQDFIDPNTGKTIEASSLYSHQWISSDQSTLIQTNDPTLDPNGVVYPVSQSWTELVPK
jgi:hypothetical protein